MSSTPKLDQFLSNGQADRGALIMKAFTVAILLLNAFLTGAFGFVSTAIMRSGIWWLDGAIGALYYLLILDIAALAWHYGQLSAGSTRQRFIAGGMKILSALASVAMSLAYVTLYTSLWDASQIIPYAQIGGAIIIYVMTAGQFLAYIAYRDTSPQHVAASAHAAMRAEIETNKLEKQAEAMTDSLLLVDELMTTYRDGIAQQHAHDIVSGLLDMMQYRQDGARELPQAANQSNPPTPQLTPQLAHSVQRAEPIAAVTNDAPTPAEVAPAATPDNAQTIAQPVRLAPSSNGTAVERDNPLSVNGSQ